MARHEDSTRTPEAKERARTIRRAHQARNAAKRDTDAALRAMMRPYQGRRFA